MDEIKKDRVTRINRISTIIFVIILCIFLIPMINYWFCPFSEKCNGKCFDKNSQICINGTVCFDDEELCNGRCYIKGSSECINGMVIPYCNEYHLNPNRNNSCICGGKNGTILPPGRICCGENFSTTICPSGYQCCDDKFFGPTCFNPTVQKCISIPVYPKYPGG